MTKIAPNPSESEYASKCTSGNAGFKTSRMKTAHSASVTFAILYSFGSAFAGPDADAVVQRQHENLAVADLSRAA